MISSTAAGAIVHPISSSECPRVCTAGGAPGRSRYLRMTHTRSAKTTTAMMAVATVTIVYRWKISWPKSERGARLDCAPSQAHPPMPSATVASTDPHSERALAPAVTASNVTAASEAPQPPGPEGRLRGREVEQRVEQHVGAALDGVPVAHLVDA